MRLVLFISALLFALPAHGTAPVLLEMFTSQGCEDTPPAQDMLSQLRLEDSDLIILNCHASYFNHTGWVDRFSNEACDERHADYFARLKLGTIQTPEIILNGNKVGNSESLSALRKEILSLRGQAPLYDLKALRDGGILTLGFPPLTPATPLDIWLFMLEQPDELSITAGPNKGLTAQPFNVVTSIQKLGIWRGGKAMLDLDIDEKLENFALILQEENQGRVIAAKLF